MAYKSKYLPENKEKYVGNFENIICRSTWERKMCKYLDLNENVINWNSEELTIPYYSPIDKKWHKYYPDFLTKIKDKKGEIKTYLIEVKPKKQTKEPNRAKMQKKTYMKEMCRYTINKCKWEAAKKLCDENGWIFKILTEDDLFR
jgi:hypothetical protein|tara:strand:- start:17584 stop:18018 length:435 start_codon:yes stop_codon:yes gene_type:complete